MRPEPKHQRLYDLYSSCQFWGEVVVESIYHRFSIQIQHFESRDAHPVGPTSYPSHQS